MARPLKMPAGLTAQQARTLSRLSTRLTFRKALIAHARAQDKEQRALYRYRDAARKLAAPEEGALEVDENAVVSKGAVSSGAYVQAWMWVSDEDAGIEDDADYCEVCGEAYTDGGPDEDRCAKCRIGVAP